MKVAFIADSLPPSTDGVARSYTNLVGTLQQKGVEFCFISPFKPGDDISWSDKVFQVYYIPFLLYPHYRLGLPLMQKLQEKLDDFQPDIIHVSSPTFMGKMGVNYAGRRHIPAVASYHTDFVAYFKYYGFQRVEDWGWAFLRWFYNQFDKTLAPSQTTATILKEQGFENVTLWERGIDIERFSSSLRSDTLREHLAPEGKPLLLFVGRLVKEKDLDDLVQIDKILRNRGLTFKFVIVGDGPMREELEMQLPDAHFTGYLHGTELSTMYASSDIFVFPSTTETFGNVILEAFASGLPVVTVDKGGVSDLVLDGRNGYICPSNQPVKLADKIQHILKNKDLKAELGKQALVHARSYSWDAINSNLLGHYKELIKTYKSLQSAA